MVVRSLQQVGKLRGQKGEGMTVAAPPMRQNGVDATP
jgi:hypothetical protein